MVATPTIAQGPLEALADMMHEERASGVAALVEDGWPKSMARAGLTDHLRTWCAAEIVEAIEWELTRLNSADGPDRVWRSPRRVAHLWPALPGAGVTPVLMGVGLGADQWIRPSSRCQHFARWLHECWQASLDRGAGASEAPAMHWMTPEAASISDLLEAPGPNLDAVVVSGSDETVRRVADRVRQLERGEPPARRVTVSGYGDRISLAVVPPADAWRIDDGAARSTHARQIARDIVMWHQAGCFSVQAVLVCGDDARQQAWADAIGREITDWEERWSADLDDERALAARADRQGLAEFRGTRRPKDGSGFGFAELVDGPVRRESLISSVPHVVPVHRTDGEPEQLVDAIDIQPRHLQGAAVVGWSAHADHAQDGHDEMARWVEAVRRVGATRICGSGELQRPSAGWLHDGALNVTTWGRWCTLE